MSNPLEENQGIYSESGKCLIETPAPEMLRRFEKNARVEYFRARVAGVVKEHYPIPDNDVEAMKEGNLIWKLYRFCMLDQLNEHLGETLGDGPLVGMRGTVCSIAGEIDHEDLYVKNLDQTLIDGTEKDDNVTLITTMGEGNKELHYRTTQWLIDGPQLLRRRLSEQSDLQAKLFPILLVYDLGKLTPGYHYSAILPSSAEERARAILKAYILDYPKAVWEI